MYKDEYHPQVKKDLKKLDLKLRQLIETEYIPEILSTPQKGEHLVGDLRDIPFFIYETGIPNCLCCSGRGKNSIGVDDWETWGIL